MLRVMKYDFVQVLKDIKNHCIQYAMKRPKDMQNLCMYEIHHFALLTLRCGEAFKGNLKTFVLYDCAKRLCLVCQQLTGICYC